MKFSLPKLFQKATDAVYAAILLSAEGGTVLYLRKQDQKETVSIIGSQKLRIRAGLDGLIDDLDDALYNLDTSHKVRAEELILFVSDAHIDPHTRQLHKPFMKSIKDISKNLDLKPIGFIECYEAITRTAHASGLPADAVLLEVENTSVSVIVTVGGQIVHHDKVARLDDWLSSVYASLATLKHQVRIPHQVIVYSPDSTPIHDKSIEQYEWNDLFGHAHPQIRHYSHEELIDALLESFAKQLFPQKQSAPVAASAVAAPVVEATAPEPVRYEEPFVSDADEMVDGEMNEEDDEDMLAAEEMGFAVGHEMQGGPVSEEQPAFHAPAVHEYRPPDEAVDVDDEGKASGPFALLGGAGSIVAAKWMAAREGVMGLLSRKHTQPAHSVSAPSARMSVGMHKMALVIAGVISFLAVLVFLEFAVHSATVVLSLPSDELTQTVRLPSSFRYKQSTISSDFSAKTSTTGEKFVGDRAKGSVTIYNSDTSSSVNLQKGQEITSSDGLVYQLNDAVKIASASGDASSITSSTAKVDVTASDIGSEYNVKTGTKFSIDGFSSTQMIAKNESDIGGGSKKKVTVVSEADYERLAQDVEKQAQEFTQKKLKETDSLDVVIIPEFTDTELSKKVYTSDIGDEVDQVALDTTATVSYTAIDKKEALSYFETQFTKSAGADKKLLPDTFGFTVKKGTSGDADAPRVTVEGTIKSVQNVEEEKIKKEIAYKSPAEATDYLKNSYRAGDVTISQIPPLPLWIPAAGRIKLTVEY